MNVFEKPCSLGLKGDSVCSLKWRTTDVIIDMLNYNIVSVSDWYNRTMVKYKKTSGDAKIRKIHLLSGWLPSLKQT